VAAVLKPSDSRAKSFVAAYGERHAVPDRMARRIGCCAARETGRPVDFAVCAPSCARRRRPLTALTEILPLLSARNTVLRLTPQAAAASDRV
jgi:hypothetical protein